MGRISSRRPSSYRPTPRMKRLALSAVAVVVTMGATVAWASTYSVTHDARVRGVVLFVGDSNEVKAAAAIDHQFTARPDGYVPMMSARGGSSIRSSDCTFSQQCDAPSSDYWKYRIADILLRVVPDAVVVNFGINDASSAGRVDSLGYANYGAKIDWLMQQIPGPIPVLWTNLPCAIEPTKFKTGCSAVNNALSQARGRRPS